jgi:hypothetical protein
VVLRAFALRVPVPALRAVVVLDLLAVVPLDFAARVVLALRVPVDARFDVERFEVELFARDPLDALRPSPAVPDPPLSSHLPDMTRCAASATASAISDPSFDALATIVLAAAWAESAASRPASRILRRAAGLALIAAAAAARPAASISRLIAAFASLSSVSLPDPLVLLDLAIAILPFGLSQKTLQPLNGSVSPSERCM